MGIETNEIRGRPEMAFPPSDGSWCDVDPYAVGRKIRQSDPDYVRNFSTDLRDREQTPEVHLVEDEKIAIAIELDRNGVDVIEAGFAIASPAEFKAVRAVAVSVGSAVVCSLARADAKDIDAAGEATEPAKYKGGSRIHVFDGVSPLHMKKNGTTPEKVLERTAQSVRLAAAITNDVEFSGEDFTRGFKENPAFVIRVYETAVENGATTINVTDTVGITTPDKYGYMVSKIVKAVHRINPKVIVSTHCHDDLGNAVANSIAGVKNGARQVEGIFGRGGERTSNASLETVIATIDLLGDDLVPGKKIRHGINSRGIYALTHFISDVVGISIDSTAPVVGKNAFTDVGGTHQAGVARYWETYHIMRPEDVGHPGPEASTGKLSGRAGIGSRLEIMSIRADETALRTITKLVKNRADEVARDLLDNEVEKIAALVTGENIKDEIELEDWQIIGGPKGTIGEVQIDDRGVKKSGRTNGVGGIDALVKAANLAMGFVGDIGKFNAASIKPGSDGSASGKVEVVQNGHRFSVYVESTSVDATGINGYMTAINMIRRAKRRRLAQQAAS